MKEPRSECGMGRMLPALKSGASRSVKWSSLDRLTDGALFSEDWLDSVKTMRWTEAPEESPRL